jgi:hypothetical protein
MPRPTSRDTGQLSIQIDAAADILPKLLMATREKRNQAMVAGDLEAADKLDDLCVKYNLQCAVLIRHEIEKIDDSKKMRKAIRGFAAVNESMQAAIDRIQKLTEYLKKAAQIAKSLDQLIAFAIKALA